MALRNVSSDSLSCGTTSHSPTNSLASSCISRVSASSTSSLSAASTPFSSPMAAPAPARVTMALLPSSRSFSLSSSGSGSSVTNDALPLRNDGRTASDGYSQHTVPPVLPGCALTVRTLVLPSTYSRTGPQSRLAVRESLKASLFLMSSSSVPHRDISGDAPSASDTPSPPPVVTESTVSPRRQEGSPFDGFSKARSSLANPFSFSWSSNATSSYSRVRSSRSTAIAAMLRLFYFVCDC
mmetsp:Transcript_36719/g.92011  ORF Transcript_36719/g.92011 Transcript_36719/m.92011 type:complete len:239 (-) Transcript_36719:71-787(-)